MMKLGNRAGCHIDVADKEQAPQNMTEDLAVAVVAGMEHSDRVWVVAQWPESGTQLPCVIGARQNVDQSGSCCCTEYLRNRRFAYPAGVRKVTVGARDYRLEACFREAES